MKKSLLKLLKFIGWNTAATLAVVAVSIFNHEVGEMFGDTVKACVSAPLAEEAMKAAFSAMGCPWAGYVLGSIEFTQYVFERGIPMELRIPQILFHTATGIIYAVVCKARNINGLTEAAESRVFLVTVWGTILFHALSNARVSVLPIPHWVGGTWVGYIANPVYYMVELSAYAIIAIVGSLYLTWKKRG